VLPRGTWAASVECTIALLPAVFAVRFEALCWARSPSGPPPPPVLAACNPLPAPTLSRRARPVHASLRCLRPSLPPLTLFPLLQMSGLWEDWQGWLDTAKTSRTVLANKPGAANAAPAAGGSKPLAASGGSHMAGTNPLYAGGHSRPGTTLPPIHGAQSTSISATSASRARWVGFETGVGRHQSRMASPLFIVVLGSLFIFLRSAFCVRCVYVYCVLCAVRCVHARQGCDGGLAEEAQGR
jgi:hypothetical protein